MHGVMRDIAYGCRRLAATPAFLIFAVASLALGLGVTTAAYSILYSIFWKPIGVYEPDRVVVATTPWSAPRWRLVMSQPDFDDARNTQKTFAAIGATAGTLQSVMTPLTSEMLRIEGVTGGYFAAVGVQPLRGRVLQPADRDARVAVISERLWRTRFNADPAIVGQVLRIGGHPFEIVGVVPPAFGGVARTPRTTALWLPLDATEAFASARWNRTDRAEARLTVVGRLPPARTIAQAASELSAIGGSLDHAYPLRSTRPTIGDRRRQRDWGAIPIERALAPPNPWVGVLLIGLIALVLVVACANLANLMLARGAVRRREIAVRRALGASRARVVRELVIESAIVAVLGGALGVVLTRLLLVAGTIEIPMSHGSLTMEPLLNWPALGAAAAAVLLSLLVFGLEPAIQLTRRNVTADLAADAGTGVPRPRRQRVLIRVQVAIATCLFLVAAIVARTIAAGAAHDPGIALDRLALATVHFPLLGWDEARARRTLDRAVEIAGRHPAIESIAVSAGMPFGGLSTRHVEIATPDAAFAKRPRYADFSVLLPSTPAIFSTLQVPIVRGRAFADRDDAGAPPVAILSELAARRLFGTVDAVGQRILMKTDSRAADVLGPLTVIGIARDTDVQRHMERVQGAVWVPFAQRYSPAVMIAARTSGKPAAAATVMQDALRQADPGFSTTTAGPATALLAGEMVVARFAGALAGTLGFLTLILSMVGLYGIQMHVVASRTREVGLRMALGASIQQIQRMILGQGYRPVIEGVLLGMVFGIIARLALRAAIVARMDVFDPLAFALVPIPLFASALLAAYLPARRAARVDPNVALRHL
jgi:predicted permease